jgi:hypothetical protein
MNAPENFFVGWSGRLAPGLRRLLLPVVALLLLGFPLAGLLLGALADDPADADFGTVPGAPAFADLPQGVALEGLVLDEGPYPLFHLPPAPGHPRGRTLTLSGDGKVGVPWDRAALAGRVVATEGFVLRRGDMEMLIPAGEPRVLDRTQPAPPVEPLGRWRITGEICDGKCAAGGMRPGTGIAHRACATLCLDGELPAVFVATAPVAGHAFLLLADAEGRSPWPAFRDLVARPVTLEGRVERRGDLLVFRADLP